MKAPLDHEFLRAVVEDALDAAESAAEDGSTQARLEVLAELARDGPDALEELDEAPSSDDPEGDLLARQFVQSIVDRRMDQARKNDAAPRCGTALN